MRKPSRADRPRRFWGGRAASSEDRKRPKPAGDLRICGLGVRPLEDATLEALTALGACRVVFSGIADPGTVDWLRPYCLELRPSPGAAAIVACVRRGGSVGLAVWGHPQSCSELARRTRALAASAGVACRVYAGVSPIGGVLCRSPLFLGGEEGMRAMRSCELKTLLRRPSLLADRMPLAVFAEEAGPGEWLRLARLLRRTYSSRHRVWVHGLEGGEPRAFTLSRLSFDGGAVVYVPNE